MAIDETELPKGPLDTQGDDAVGARGPALFSAQDFRLRLDAPLFHRDPGMSTGQAPQLRELTWEHVVRPAQPTSVIESERALLMPDIEPRHGASIESLLANALESVEPKNFVEQLKPVEPVKRIESLSGEIPLVVGMPVVGMSVVGMPVIGLPSVGRPIIGVSAEVPVVARYSIDDELEVVPPLPAATPGMATLFAVLEQMDAGAPVGEADAAHSTKAHFDALDSEVADDAVAVPVDVAVPVAVDAEIDVKEPVIDDSPAAVALAVASAAVPVVKSPPAAVSSVEAELNRLAFLPDQGEDDGPVVVPTISYTEPRADVAPPSLSQNDLYAARRASPAAHARLNPFDASTMSTFVSHKKKKKNALVRLIPFLLFIGLLAGAAYAGKYYFLDKRWEGDVKALAREVEEARGLSFDHAITVTTLPVPEYATKLVTLAFGLSDETTPTQAAEWRALGVLNGPLDLGQIGLAALPDSPAFYDPASETIFVADEIPADLYRFGMHRALALALLDQQFGWGRRTEGVSPGVARGTRAYFDGDALATAVELASPAERTDIVTQIFGLYGTYEIAASPAPFASIVAGRLGLSLRPYFESIPTAQRALLEKDAVVTDGQALDLRRLTAGIAESPGLVSQGMLFWYHALASRIDENTAWEAALAWHDDDVTVVENAAGPCVVAHLQVAQASLDSVSAAFQAWAAAAPPSSGTTVTLATDSSAMQIVINACDPGVGVPTNAGTGHLALGGAPLRAEQYRLLMEAQPTLSSAQGACAVFGGDAVSMADERGVIDNAEGWPAPANHPLPDPNRLDCAPA